MHKGKMRVVQSSPTIHILGLVQREHRWIYQTTLHSTGPRGRSSSRNNPEMGNMGKMGALEYLIVA